MSVRWEILLLILACTAVTLVPRTLPFIFARRITLPRWCQAWLQHIPVAVMSVLFFRETLLSDGAWRDWHDPYLLAAFPTLAVAFLTRNLFITIFFGMACFSFLRLLL